MGQTPSSCSTRWAAAVLGAGLLLGSGASVGCYKSHGLDDEPRSAAGREMQDPFRSPMNSAGDAVGTGEQPMTRPAASPDQPVLGCVDAPHAAGRADLLFVVDNSGSMKQEQESLREQFPRMIRVLTSGDVDGDGMQDFPPAKDLHLGVVSTDLGLVGIQDIEKCEGLGDDGLLLHEPSPLIAGCQAAYPTFLTYTSGINDPNQTANDFACIATLGTDGCGFEQQLESGLKALWPANAPLPSPDGRSSIDFLGDVNGIGTQGHGDRENAGFLRNDPAQGLSLIAVVVVTDEEDCSSEDTSHFTPAHFLQPDDPLAQQALNLRCFYNKENLFSIERYVSGFRALRPGNEALVMFAAIVGVPPDLVGEEARARIDFTSAPERQRYYERILSDPRMQEQIDPTRTPEQGGNLIPSCNTARGVAYPPRRIVETARRFGENGVVQSICQEDFGPALDAILLRIGERLRDPCAQSSR